jgi:hypothetical protein
MGQPPGEIMQSLAEQLCWEVARAPMLGRRAGRLAALAAPAPGADARGRHRVCAE